MWGVSREVCFSQKMFTNDLNMGLPLRACFEKTVYGEETCWPSGKEKVPDAAISKADYTDSLLGHERTNHNWIPWTWGDCKPYLL